MTSTIKVNTVKDTASTDIIKKCGTSITVGTASDTTTVAGNAVRSNAIQASDGQNIISQVGTTITLGATGDTINLASGASQSGFGRTGTVDWDTTPKTSTVTAANGVGYFVNTTAGAISVNLPAGTAGDVVAIKDYANTFDTNAVTLVQNGSDKIGGSTANISLETEGIAVTLVFVDSTQGWLVTDSGLQSEAPEPPAYVTATGGTPTTSPCGDYKIHTFTGPGAFCVSCAGNSAGSNTVDYLVIAGGGGGGSDYAGGGGAGGFRLSNSTCMPAPTTSPLANPTGIPVTVTSFPIAVGGGGAGGLGPVAKTNGSNSIFSSIISAGGGFGGGQLPATPTDGNPGGSGGGAQSLPSGNRPGGTGNTPPVSPAQGKDGGVAGSPSNGYGGAGGGGATIAGTVGNSGAPSSAGAGGTGAFVSPLIAGSNGTTGPVGSVRYFSGGGGGAADANRPIPVGPGNGAGGAGGGGRSGQPNYSSTSGPDKNRTSESGTTNTGGGGGAGAYCGVNAASGNGGTGIVIIRYKFQ